MSKGQKCGNPIWVTKEIHMRVSERAKAHRRSRGNEVAAMLDELDKIVPTNVPVLNEKKTTETMPNGNHKL